MVFLIPLNLATWLHRFGASVGPCVGAFAGAGAGAGGGGAVRRGVVVGAVALAVVGVRPPGPAGGHAGECECARTYRNVEVWGGLQQRDYKAHSSKKTIK